MARTGLVLLIISLLAAGCFSSGRYLSTRDLVGACSAGLMDGTPEQSYLEPALYAACYTYLAASVDAVYAGAADKRGKRLLPAVCMPGHLGIDEARNVFLDYLSENPDRARSLSHEVPYLAVVEAFSRAFPCTGDDPSVFRDVASLKGSLKEIDGASRICLTVNIDERTLDYAGAKEIEKESHAFFVYPGYRKLRVRCGTWQDDGYRQVVDGFVEFIARPAMSYELVELPKYGEPETDCFYIRNIETMNLVGSTCP